MNKHNFEIFARVSKDSEWLSHSWTVTEKEAKQFLQQMKDLKSPVEYKYEKLEQE